MGFDEKWLEAYCMRTGKANPLEKDNVHTPEEGLALKGGAGKPDRNKYGNQPVQAEGRRFDSRHEARTYERLRLECLAGEHAGLGCQVAFYLPGGVKYLADFVVLEKDGSYRVLDAKSEATRKDKTYRLKKRQMKNCLGITVEEV